MIPIYLNPQYIFLLYKQNKKELVWPSEFINCASSLPIEPNPYKIQTNEKPLSQRINLNSTMTFDDCMKESVEKLSRIKGTFALYWSGGMDSTAMIAAIETFNPNLIPRINIVATNGSVLENPDGFKYLKQKYNFLSANKSIEDIAKFHTIIHGNSSDRLCCSVSAHYIISKYSEDILWEPYETLFSLKSYEHFSLYRNIVEFCPINIKTVYDFLWWHSISQGSASTLKKIRSIEFKDRAFIDNIFHFFDSDNFVSWSVLNQDKIIPNQKWANYKNHVRQFCKEYFPIEMTTNAQYPSNWFYYYLRTNIACEFTDACFNLASDVSQEHKDYLLCISP